MNDTQRSELSSIMAGIEENWANLNVLFDEISASSGWDRKHGADWTFADLPYHLAYCNRDILIRSLQAGADLPENDQELLTSLEAINDWNARELAARPAGQTAEESVAEWRATCEQIKTLAAAMTDADLERPFWMTLFAGWNQAREGFNFIRAHDWGEFMQLRILMGRTDPVPSPGLTQAYLSRMLGAYRMFFNPEAAQGRHFTAVMAFTDPGVEAYTLAVEDGVLDFRQAGEPQADLVMTQSAETFLKSLTGMHNPAEALQNGLIRVNDFEALATFGALFPLPT